MELLLLYFFIALQRVWENCKAIHIMTLSIRMDFELRLRELGVDVVHST